MRRLVELISEEASASATELRCLLPMKCGHSPAALVAAANNLRRLGVVDQVTPTDKRPQTLYRR